VQLWFSSRLISGLALAAFSIMATPPGLKNIDPAEMDQSIKPGDDFYRYANGGWLS